MVATLHAPCWKAHKTETRDKRCIIIGEPVFLSYPNTFFSVSFFSDVFLMKHSPWIKLANAYLFARTSLVSSKNKVKMKQINKTNNRPSPETKQ